MHVVVLMLVLRLSVVVSARLSATLRFVAKWCVLEQKLLLTAYRIRNRLVPKWMTLTFV